MKVVIIILILAVVAAIIFVAVKKDDSSSNDTVVTKVKTENENGSNEPVGGKDRDYYEKHNIIETDNTNR